MSVADQAIEDTLYGEDANVDNCDPLR